MNRTWKKEILETKQVTTLLVSLSKKKKTEIRWLRQWSYSNRKSKTYAILTK